ncbi:MAG: VanW family protein [Gemmatimonadaceae bacterium]|nr:VanW family protein [Gloeobacterales cyanobacterium ES-bin-141]
MKNLLPLVVALTVLVIAHFSTATAQQPPSEQAPEPRTDLTSSEPEAARLASAFSSKLSVPVTLSDGTRTLTQTRQQWGIRLDIERMLTGGKNDVAFKVDTAATTAAVEKVAGRFEQPAVDAKLYLSGGKLKIAPDVPGHTLDISATVEQLARAVESDPATQRLTVPYIDKPARITASYLKEINGQIASFTTQVGGNSSRLRNVKLATAAIDGTLLAPGETFSLDKVVGPRTRKRGYREATVFVDAKEVEGIGGGVSQVTGTLFNAAALAGLAIKEVHPHSRPVSYLPLGRDATVARGLKDLKFVNNTNTPIYISYTLRNRSLQAVIYGRKVDGQKVSLTRQVRRRAPGHVKAQLYRTIRLDGIDRKERILSHTYRWKPG